MTQNMQPSDISELDIDFTGEEDLHAHCEDELIMNTMIEHVFSGANHQMQVALELTKISMGQTAQPNPEEVLKIYTNALQTVAQTSPIPHLLNIMGAELADD
jgi:hypothetical protein